MMEKATEVNDQLIGELQVFKFGGASIKDATSIRALAEQLNNLKGHPLLLVVSALGKTTNALEQVLQNYLDGENEQASAAFRTIRDAHIALCQELIDDRMNPIWVDLNELMIEVEWLLEDELHDSQEYLYDQIVCLGELLSTRIIAAYLDQLGLPVRWEDARGLLITDDTYSTAVPNLPESKERMQDLDWNREQEWLIVQGFIGGTDDNNSTTLGREGSDFSAVLFAHLAGCREVTLWKDVDGIYESDPKLDPTADRLEELSYDEALSVIEDGGKIIHPKALTLARDEDIQIRVRSFLKLDDAGSMIA